MTNFDLNALRHGMFCTLIFVYYDFKVYFCFFMLLEEISLSKLSAELFPKKARAIISQKFIYVDEKGDKFRKV